jgi:RimJ/RimL family protein N-acetyltransferase
VNWSCDAENIPSMRIAEKLGFTFAGNVACFEYSAGHGARF